MKGKLVKANVKRIQLEAMLWILRQPIFEDDADNEVKLIVAKARENLENLSITFNSTLNKLMKEDEEKQSPKKQSEFIIKKFAKENLVYRYRWYLLDSNGKEFLSSNHSFESAEFAVMEIKHLQYLVENNMSITIEE